MNKIFTLIIAFFLFFPLSLSIAKDKEAEKNEKEKPPAVTEAPKDVKMIKKPKYDGEAINKFIKEFTDKVKDDGKGKSPILANEFLIYTGILQNYYKYPDVELETQIYRVWYKKLYDAVSGMYKVRQESETAVFMNQKEKVDKYREDYKKYFNDFKNLIINKKKFEIPDDKLRELQKKKDEAEREAKKKSRK